MNLPQLVAFFEQYRPTDEAFVLSPCETLLNQKLFIETHLTILKANSGNQGFLPYFHRLTKYYNLITK